MPVEVAEINAATAAPVVGLTVLEGEGAAPVDDPFGPDATEDLVELLLTDLERVVVPLEVLSVVEVERQRIVQPDGGEVAQRLAADQAEDPGEELRRLDLVVTRNDRVVELGHVGLLPCPICQRR